MKETISVILTVHNQEMIIGKVIKGILDNVSRSVQEVSVIFDGCTDDSEDVANWAIINHPNSSMVTTFITPNLNETLANNYGLSVSSCDYAIIVQDDCLIKEPKLDQRLLEPFRIVPNLLAVSGRDAVDTRLVNGRLDYYNCGGKDANTPRNIFSIRDAVNRSPLMLDHNKALDLGYFDEDFAPLDSDDVDLSIRGYKKHGWLVGSYVIDYESPLHWGKTRNNANSARIWEASMIKNHKLIVKRHYDFIVGEKHSEDIIIP